jgi:transcriptional regulator with XRE-family HTH domain
LRRLKAIIQGQILVEPEWSKLIKHYRLQHHLTQERLGLLLGVSQKTISRWERDEDRPRLDQQRRFRDLAAEPADTISQTLRMSVEHCPAQRGLSFYKNLRLIAVSRPAIAKRPSIVNWIGRDLLPLACGVLAEMRDDAALQRDIAKGEVLCVSTVSRSVLRTPEHEQIGTHQTTISYYWIDGRLFSDAIGVPAPCTSQLGYTPLRMDELTGT